VLLERDGSVRQRGSCVTLAASHLNSSPAEVELVAPTAGLELSARGGPARVAIRRFAARWHPLGTVSQTRTADVRIGPDLALRPWQVQVFTDQRATVCALVS
jgi:hypothetical protein